MPFSSLTLSACPTNIVVFDMVVLTLLCDSTT
jgi:hypothetical protein